MTRAPFFRPLALAAALAALGAGPAHAMSDWQRECQRGTYEINPYTPCAQPFHEGLAAVMTGSEEDEAGRWGYIDKQGRMAIAPAFQEATPFQNGLAAVRQDDLWGYIDAKGAWAIRPAYAEATGFNAQGTALVRIDERDVLIDRQGQTVKTLPLGARSWGFRPGQTLAEIEVPQPPRLFNVATGRALTLPDDVMALGEPTQGQIPAQRRASRYNGWWGLLSANGRWAVPPETLRSEEAPLRDGNVIAVRRDGRWQFVDPQGRPLSKQRYGDRVALLAPGAWLVKREHNAPAILLDADLRPMRSFRQDYAWPEKREGWTVLRDDEAILLVDPVGRLSILSLPQGRVDIQNGRAWVYARTSDGATDATTDGATDEAVDATHAAIDASQAAANTSLAEPPSPRTARKRNDRNAEPGAAADAAQARPAREPDPAPPTPLPVYRLPDPPAVADPPPPMVIMPKPAANMPAPGPTAMPVEAQAADAAPVAVDAAQEAGQAVDAAVAEAAVAEAAADAAAAAADAAIGSANRPETLIQIYAADGQPLLSHTQAARLRDYSVTPVQPDKRLSAREAALLPLATLSPSDYEQPNGILTADGKIVIDPSWSRIATYDASLPLVTHTRDDKVGAIDAAGRWAVPPRYQELDTFNSGYAWALPFDANSRNQTVLLDALGRKTALPDAVRRNGEYLDGGLITYYALDDDHERVWGLWDIRKNAPALKPSLAGIEKFEGDWARAQSGDRWGVIGRDGKWRIKPDYEGAYRLDYLGQGYMLTEEAKPAGQSDAYDSFYRLHHLPSGKASPLLRGKPQALEGGRQMGLLADGGTMLFDARGGSVRLFQGKPENQRQFGDWISLSYDDRKGAIDARGNMKIAAENGEFNPFFVQPDGLARVNTPQGYRLMDQNGAIVQARLGDAMPLASMQRLVVEDRDGSRSVMVDMQGREIARFNKTYSVDASTASEGVVVYEGDNGRHGFVNAEGKRVVGPYFNKLGPLRDGLARARREQRSGKLYGYIDLTGRYAIAPEFAWADDFREGRALARRGDQLMYIDPRGQAAASFSLVCGAVVIQDAQQRVTLPAKPLACPDAAGLQYAPATETAQAGQS